MTTSNDYLPREPSAAEVAATPGLLLLEFGAPWCGICRGAQPNIRDALAVYPALRHLKVFDGRGQPLGRRFRVKLWPTLILLRDGHEVGRAVRPNNREAVLQLLAAAGTAVGSGADAR